MKKQNCRNKIFSSITLFLLCFTIFISTGLADASSVSTNVKVEQIFTVSGSALTEEESTFSYVLESLASSNPMPAVSVEGLYAFTLVGTQDLLLPDLVYTQEGIYEYNLYQTIPNKAHYTYDTRIYNIVIHVKTKNTGDLGAEIVVYNQDGKKAAAIVFQNAYNGSMPSSSPSVSPTPSTPHSPTPTNMPPATTAPLPTGDSTSGMWLGIAFVFFAIFLGIALYKRMAMAKK